MWKSFENIGLQTSEKVSWEKKKKETCAKHKIDCSQNGRSKNHFISHDLTECLWDNFGLLYAQCIVKHRDQNNLNFTTPLIDKRNINLPLAIRKTLMARMIVGLMGINPDLISSRIMPIIDSMTIPISRRFQLQWKKQHPNKIQSTKLWHKAIMHAFWCNYNSVLVTNFTTISTHF